MQQKIPIIARILFTTVLFSVIINSANALGFQYENWKLGLAVLPTDVGNKETRATFFEKQVLPIMNAFRITDLTLDYYSKIYRRPFTIDDLREGVTNNTRDSQGVRVIFTMNMPGDLSGHYYISKVGEYGPTHMGEPAVYKDDVLLLETPEREIELDDFFISGGSVDTPPCSIVEADDVLPLVENFFEKYRHGTLICVSSETRKKLETYRPPRIPYDATPDFIAEFSTESYDVSDIPEVYKVDNGIGNDAYVIPLGAWGKDAAYAGVQTFYVRENPSCKVSSYIEGTGHVEKLVPIEPTEPSSKRMLEAYKLRVNDAIQACEEIRTKYSVPIEEFECKLCCSGHWVSGVYVDKLFFREPETTKAVEADWILFSDTTSGSHECFDVSYGQGIPQTIEVDFDYEVLSRTDGEVNVRFEATGSGNIANYFWDFGDGSAGKGAVVEHTYKPGQYGVILTAVDAKGRKRRIIKTINLGERIEFKIWADNTGLGEKTILHVRCSSPATVNVRIDKVNENLEEEFAFIEAQPVRCNSDLPIGPFSFAGRYLVKGYLNEVKKESGFTIS